MKASRLIKGKWYSGTDIDTTLTVIGVYIDDDFYGRPMLRIKPKSHVWVSRPTMRPVKVRQSKNPSPEGER